MSGLGTDGALLGALPLYLAETLIWTGVLIAAVLFLRRPVARWFGPQIAYALWAIPALRLILPPLELPAWMGPADAAATAASASGSGTETQILPILDPAFPVATPDGTAGVEVAAPGASAPITHGLMSELWLDAETLIVFGMAVWLTGAAVFLFLRFSAYFRLRDELLTDARDVGRDVGRGGSVRLIETPGTRAPLAFGVFDKVIALPIGFMAQHDRTARDLALAHEMAHHRARDLLINVLVQPLFALHWFNPLSRYGWLALRRDQEAACDARVIASHPAVLREAYANLIVKFAAAQADPAPDYALAAPMACPVLGEKSIIHRLRSLKMNNTTQGRRMAGRLMLGAAVIALPLTASISYAASDAVADNVQAPAAPPPPTAPNAPAAPPAPPAPPSEYETEAIITTDPDTAAVGEGTREEHVFIFHADGNDEVSSAPAAPGDPRVERFVIRDGENSTDEHVEEIMIEMRRGLAEADRAMAEMPQRLEQALAEARSRRGEAREGRTIIEMSCDRSSDEVATTTENADGTRTVMLCQTRVMAQALQGLRQAREAISRARDLDAATRGRILRELDQQIDQWEDEHG
ncbi:M56 family metallopeptidase [Qipengyuania sp. ASV99]|uniref:M56 family metallopeptidase n=1 Tax=Qipengyuania sp. ASV99 TaxID=3399681 RepID=UPI003A4C5488